MTTVNAVAKKLPTASALTVSSVTGVMPWSTVRWVVNAWRSNDRCRWVFLAAAGPLLRGSQAGFRFALIGEGCHRNTPGVEQSLNKNKSPVALTDST